LIVDRGAGRTDRDLELKTMAYTYHELKAKTIQELRDIAKDVQHDAVQGFSQMNKEHLLPALCHALGISTHEHAEVAGIDKPAIKAKMRELKAKRSEVLANGDHAALKAVRRQIHGLNREIRRHILRTA
jgi:DNA-binding IclR family transcriptional regulator